MYVQVKAHVLCNVESRKNLRVLYVQIFNSEGILFATVELQIELCCLP